MSKYKNLDHRQKLQIQKSHMVNAMEFFLSSLMNDAYSALLGTEFVVCLDPFDFSHHSISSAAKNYTTHVYYLDDGIERNKEIFNFDMGFTLNKIFWLQARNSVTDQKTIDLLKKIGFGKIAVAEMQIFLSDFGSKVLTEKISTIQSTFGFSFEAGGSPKKFEDNKKAEPKLLECMIEITNSISKSQY